MGDFAVELHDVVKEFPGATRGSDPVRAVDHVTLRIGDGEFFLPGFNIPKGTTRYAAFDDGFQSKMRTNVFNISPTQKLWGLL